MHGGGGGGSDGNEDSSDSVSGVVAMTNQTLLRENLKVICEFLESPEFDDFEDQREQVSKCPLHALHTPDSMPLPPRIFALCFQWQFESSLCTA